MIWHDKILVVTDADMAEAYRIQFYLHWEKGTPV